MGVVLSLFAGLADLIELTGFSAAAIATGEAAAVIGEQVAGSIAVAGLTEAEALAEIGLTTAHVSLLNTVPEVVANVVTSLSITSQISTAGAVVLPLLQANNTLEVHHTNSKMALVPYMPDLDFLFPYMQWFSSTVGPYIDPLNWAAAAADRFGYYLREHLIEQIELVGTEVLARTVENTRWAVVDGPRQLYSQLASYYEELPVLSGKVGHQYLLEGPGVTHLHLHSDEPHPSGIYERKLSAPGGAEQRHCPDWLLPLLLGLYGDLNPWNGEDDSKIKRKTTYTGASFTRKRRRRSITN